MEKIRIKKRNRIAAMKAAVRDNIQMMRFIREIEREDPLDLDTLKTMYVLKF